MRTCSGNRWCCGGARMAGPGPTPTCACTGARRCHSAGSAGMSSSARITDGVTGRTGAARPYPSWRIHPRCRPRPGSARSAARNATDWCGWPWRSRAGHFRGCPSSRTRTGRWSARGLTAGIVMPPGRWRTSPTSGTSPGSTRDCWATRTGRWFPATRSAPRDTCCTTRSSGRRRPIPMTSRSSLTSRPAPAAAQPLRTAPAVHHRTAPGLGRGTWHGLFLRLPAHRR